MGHNIRKHILLLLLIIFILIVYKIKDINKTTYIKENYYFQKLDNIILTIEKIKLKELVKKDSIKTNKVSGIVLFDEYGKPNEDNTNTIIGAHSGNGRNSFFSKLDKIYHGDLVHLYYEEKEYKYIVIDKYLVYETNTKILNNIKDKTTLTLFTCYEKNNKYRLIILLELIDFI